MIVEFRSHPDGGVVAVETNEVRAVLRARGGLPYTLIRLAEGREVVVRGTKEQVRAWMEETAERPALRLG